MESDDLHFLYPEHFFRLGAYSYDGVRPIVISEEIDTMANVWNAGRATMPFILRHDATLFHSVV